MGQKDLLEGLVSTAVPAHSYLVGLVEAASIDIQVEPRFELVLISNRVTCNL